MIYLYYFKWLIWLKKNKKKRVNYIFFNIYSEKYNIKLINILDLFKIWEDGYFYFFI